MRNTGPRSYPHLFCCHVSRETFFTLFPSPPCPSPKKRGKKKSNNAWSRVNDTNSCLVKLWNLNGQDKTNTPFWLATEADKIGLSCSLRISSFDLAEKTERKKIECILLLHRIISSYRASTNGQNGWILASCFCLCSYWHPHCIQTRRN